MIYRLILFLIINFIALAIGASFTNEGVPSDWYESVAKAPWTPPGWVFGSAWTTIMVFFGIYMTNAWSVLENKKLLMGLFTLQWILNVAWNPTFFYYHNILGGFLIISLLTLLIGFILFFYWSQLKMKSVLMLPYLIWLLVAVSLNGYTLLKS